MKRKKKNEISSILSNLIFPSYKSSYLPWLKKEKEKEKLIDFWLVFDWFVMIDMREIYEREKWEEMKERERKKDWSSHFYHFLSFQKPQPIILTKNINKIIYSKKREKEKWDDINWWWWLIDENERFYKK